jgi:hypothetical protein
MAAGENDGTWGPIANTNFADLMERAVAGMVSLAMADANYTLSANNGADDEARYKILKATGANTATRDIIVPAVSHVYVVWNATTGGQIVRVKTSGGVAAQVPNGTAILVFCDGTDCYAASGAGGGSSKVTASAVSLGTQVGVQTAWTYYTIPTVCARGMVSQFKITASAAGRFDVCARGAANDGGQLYFLAQDIQRSSYEITMPWYYENDAAGQQLYVGVKNLQGGSFTFTLANLRVEKFA